MTDEINKYDHDSLGEHIKIFRNILMNFSMVQTFKKTSPEYKKLATLQKALDDFRSAMDEIVDSSSIYYGTN